MTRPLLVPSVVLLTALVAAIAPAADDPEFGGKKLPAWVKDLSAPDVAARNTALQAVRALGPKAAPALPELLKRPSDQFACKRYWDTVRAVVGDDPAPLFDHLADDNPQVVINAQGALGRMPLSQRVLEENLLRILDRHAQGKNAAAFAGQCARLEKPNEKLAPTLHKMLDLRAAKSSVVDVALALSRVDPTDELAAANLLSDFKEFNIPDPGRMEALRRFGRAGLEATRKRMMFSNGKHLNYDFVNALRPSDDPEMGELVAVVKPHLASEFDSQRKAAAWFLAKLGKRAKDATPDLLKALTRLKDTPDEKLDSSEKAYRVEGTALARAFLAAGGDPKELKPFASRIDDLTLREALGEDVTAERVKGLKKQFGQMIDNWSDPFGGAEAGRILEKLCAVDPTDPDLPDLWYRWAKDPTRGYQVGIPQGFGRTPPGRGPVPKELLAGLKAVVRDEDRPVKERTTFAIQVVKQDPTDQDAVKLLLSELVFTPKRLPNRPKPTPQVRAGVVAAFASTGGMPQLVEWVGHEDGRVVQEAVAALGRMGPAAKPAVEKVKGTLKHADQAVRYAAVETLFAIDPTDKAGVPVLLELLSDEASRKALRQTVAANPPYSLTRALDSTGPAWDPAGALDAAVEILFDLDPEAAVKADLYRFVYPSFSR